MDEWDLLFVGCVIPSTSAFYRSGMIDEGLLCQREHIAERKLPRILGNAALLKVLRKTYQVRRVLKRLRAHGKVW